MICLPIEFEYLQINYMCCYLSGFWSANVKIKQILKIILFLLG